MSRPSIDEDAEALHAGDYIDGEPIDGEDLEDLEAEDEIEQGDTVKKPKRKLPPQTHIKSYIAILTSALGGLDYSSELDTPPYKLGEEAFLCLQDIDKWFRSHDMKENSSEVAIACAESGIVQDLVTILCMWNDGLDDENTTISGFSKRHDEKIARMCMKLLVLLTWPTELKANMYQNQLENYHTLKKHQLIYKKHILTYRNGAALQSIIKILLPIITKEKKERAPGDYNAIKQCVAFFRNLLKIEPPGISKLTIKKNKQSSLSEDLPKGVTADDVGVGACIGAFNDNLVFTFFLTMCSSIGRGQDFEPELLAPVFQDIIYLMLKTLRPQYIMQSSSTSQSQNKDNSGQISNGLALANLLSEEKAMVNKFKKNSSSRHGRFGTLLSLQTPDMGRLTMSNTGNVLGENNIIASFDAHKRWNKTRKFVYEPDEEIVFPESGIGASNREAFYQFACDFIDGAFNPFIKACTLVLTQHRQSGKISDSELISYFMMISWFLEAQRERYGSQIGDVDYTLVGAAFSQEAFILLGTSLSECGEDPAGKAVDRLSDSPRYGLAHASMITYKEVVLVANTMAQSILEENRDLSTNLQMKIFAQNTYLDALFKISKFAYKRSPDYVDSLVDTIDVTLKQLDDYASTDMKQFILNNRNKDYEKVYNQEQVTIDNVDLQNDKQITEAAEKLLKDRKNTRDWFVGQLATTKIVDAYISFIKRYEDVPEKSLKKAIKFLHRLFFQLKKESILYRLDFMLVLHSMLADEGLPKSSSNRKHAESFLKHYMRKFKKALDKTPALYVEVLFPSGDKEINHYLATGEMFVPAEKKKKVTVVNAVVTFKNEEELDLARKVGLLVAALIDSGLGDLVAWASQELEKITTVRLRQEEEPLSEEGVSPITDQFIKSEEHMKNLKLVTEARLRLLLQLAGVTTPSSTDEQCVFYSSKDLNTLIEVNTFIKMYLMSPVEVDEGRVADDYLKYRYLRDDYEKRNAADVVDPEMLAGAGYSSDEEDIAFNRNSSDEETGVGYMDNELDNLEAAIERSEQTGHSRDSRGTATRKGSAQRKQKKKKDKSSKRKSRRSRRNEEVDEGGKKKRKGKEHTDYKSMEFIVDSDDEDDEAFFAREERLRELLENNGGTLSADQLRDLLLKGESGVEAAFNDTDSAITKDVAVGEVSSSKRKPSEQDSPHIKRRKAIEDDEDDDAALDNSDSGSDGSDSDLDSNNESDDESSDSDSDKDDQTEGTPADIETDDFTKTTSDAPEFPEMGPGDDTSEDSPMKFPDGDEEEEEAVVRVPKKRAVIADSDDE